MRARIIRIGNSRGIRIPKAILEEAGLSDEVELEVVEEGLMVRAIVPSRQGWEDRFRAMSEAGDDELVDAGPVEASAWDEEEWEW
jgi:antitoxin MazE